MHIFSGGSLDVSRQPTSDSISIGGCIHSACATSQIRMSILANIPAGLTCSGTMLACRPWKLYTLNIRRMAFQQLQISIKSSKAIVQDVIRWYWATCIGSWATAILTAHRHASCSFFEAFHACIQGYCPTISATHSTGRIADRKLTLGALLWHWPAWLRYHMQPSATGLCGKLNASLQSGEAVHTLKPGHYRGQAHSHYAEWQGLRRQRVADRRWHNPPQHE